MSKDKDCIVIEDDFLGYSTKHLAVPAAYEEDLRCVLIPRGLILDRTAKIARDIFHNMDLSKPLIALCVLKGSYIFFNDLLEQLRELSAQSNRSFQMSIDFIRLKSYQDDKSTGEVKVIGGDDLRNIGDKNVLVVEDIVDTGRTMSKLLGLLNPHKPNSVHVVSLLVKRTGKSCGYRPEYVGFEIPDKFVIGYGLDYNEYFRDLGHIAIIADSAIKKYASVSSS